MKQVICLFTLLIFNTGIHAQVLTTDPALVAAIGVASAAENSSYNSIIAKQNNIEALQATTVGLIKNINDIQGKIYNGLQYVSSTATAVYQVYECGTTLKDILDYEAKMLEEAAQNPLALGFAVKVQAEMYTRAAGYFAEIQAFILKQGDKKLLMDAGERQALLYQVLLDLSVLRGLAMYSYSLVHQVVLQGVIKSLNPFNGFINTDAQIAKEILGKWKF